MSTIVEVNGHKYEVDSDDADVVAQVEYAISRAEPGRSGRVEIETDDDSTVYVRFKKVQVDA